MNMENLMMSDNIESALKTKNKQKLNNNKNMSEGHRNQLKKHPSRQTQNQLNKKLKERSITK